MTVGADEPVRRSIRFNEFRQVVRRYRPSDLLPFLGSMASSIEGPPYEIQLMRQAPPWAFALIARESILWGNEHRRPGLTADDVRLLLNAHSNINEDANHPEDRSAHSIVTRLAYEQFPYQESMFEEVSRTHALLVDGLPHVDTEVLSESAWVESLGAPLPQVVGATFFLQVAAEQNNGLFDPASMDADDFRDIFDLWPREVILQRARQLSSTFDEFKAEYATVPKPSRGHERYAFNPLTNRPFLRWRDGTFLAPQPRLILRTVSPGNLYYAGIRTFGEAFTRDLGLLTEWYVGEQLRTISGASVYPEVIYGRQHVKSIDWFLVLPSLVVMIEVKSARFGLLDRAADAGFEERIRRVLQHAVEQLRRTDEAMDARLPEFRDVPSDRPRIGLVVTAEPYYLGNSQMVRRLLPRTETPILTASLRDLERLVGLPPSAIEAELLEIVHDPERSTWNLSTALRDVSGGQRSPVLERAWDSYSWPSGMEEDSTTG